MKRLAKWYLRRHGLTVLEGATFDAAMERLRAVEHTVGASGHLSTLSGRRPHVVRKVDRGIGEVRGLVDASRLAA